MNSSAPDTDKKAEAENETVALVVDPLNRNELSQVNTIDLLFFAYRDFTAEADKVLARMDYGRAHHRTLYFINRKPGMMVAELLDILAITKQSLARVLRQLIDDQFIVQRKGETDRRQRLLYPTKKGRKFLLDLSRPQSERIAAALKRVEAQGKSATGSNKSNGKELAIGASQPVSDFLNGMIDPQNRRHVDELR